MNIENLKPDREVKIDQKTVRMFRVQDPIPGYILFEIQQGKTVSIKGGIGTTEEAGIRAALGLELGQQVIFEMEKVKGGEKHAGDIYSKKRANAV